ncbi:MAG: heavy metal sensor histidine kinase [Planctomycetes bacterium]|nr:heavy metal sensor histidine kinase [Planctomycetota bacterium]
MPEPRRRRWSIATRLAVWFALSSLGLIVAADALLERMLIRTMDHLDDEFLSRRIEILAKLVREEGPRSQRLEEEIHQEGGGSSDYRLHLRVLDPAGEFRLETAGMSAALPTDVFPEPVADGQATSSRDLDAFRIRAGKARYRDREYVIQAGLEEIREAAVLRGLRGIMALILAALLVPSILVGYLLTRRGLKPVRQIVESANRIGSATLHERVSLAGLPPELVPLAVSFNGVLDRLKTSFEQISRFSASIAHELRTPVNNLRSEAEVTLSKAREPGEYREALASCLEEAEKVKRIIDHLLFLARAEAREARAQLEEVDLCREIEGLSDYYGLKAKEAGVHLATKCPPGLSVSADRTLLQRAVSNLIENSLRHTARGGEIRIEAEAHGGERIVRVADTGTGIPADRLAGLLEGQIPPARSPAGGGLGLGLAIVRAIAALHGGSMNMASEPGKGTTVSVTIPAHPAPL